MSATLAKAGDGAKSYRPTGAAGSSEAAPAGGIAHSPRQL
jgi:hypothetical protein